MDGGCILGLHLDGIAGGNRNSKPFNVHEAAKT